MQYNVVGIGNAIVDILSNVSNDYINEHGLTKGSMILIDEKKATEFYKTLEKTTIRSGGSVANSIAGMALAGMKVAFIGKIADDEHGKNFKEDIANIGIYFNTSPLTNSAATATSTVLVTPDAQRTMNTYLGASVYLSESDIDEDLIKNSEILYLEGYLWDSDSARKAIIKSAKIAKENNTQIAFSLSDSFCVDRYKEEFLEFIKDYVSIIFANEDEIKMLFNSFDVKIAADLAKDICDTVVITLGANGAMAVTKTQSETVSVQNVTSVKDTTGAGDLFAAGFLSGYCKKVALTDCLNIGTLFASEIISHIGARPEKDLKGIVEECLKA